MTTSREQITRTGLKGRAAEILRARADSDSPTKGMALAEIAAALSLPKDEMPALNSALVKLCKDGKVLSTSGPSASSRGRKTVKRYVWGLASIRRPPELSLAAIDDRRYLSMKP